MPELADLRRDGGQGIMIKVEVDEECECEQVRGGWNLLDIDTSHVE